VIDPESAHERGGEAAATTLSSVERIYVDSLGEGTFSQLVRQRLVDVIEASERFSVVEDMETADAMLKGSAKARRLSAGEGLVGTVKVVLVNSDRTVLWSAGQTAQGPLAGGADEVAERVVKGLMDAVQRQERK
jgi:hypothetical protein